MNFVVGGLSIRRFLTMCDIQRGMCDITLRCWTTSTLTLGLISIELELTYGTKYQYFTKVPCELIHFVSYDNYIHSPF